MGSQELTTEVHELVPLFNGETPTSGTLVDQVAEAISAVLERHGVTTKVRYELHSRGIGSPVDAILFVSDTVKPKVQEVILSGANLLTPKETMEKPSGLSMMNILRHACTNHLLMSWESSTETGDTYACK
jgi:hypothetical protein